MALTTISSAAMNSDLADIADGLSTCLTTDGQSSMSAPIKGSAGTVVAPSYTFSTDLNTGIYRIGADNVGVATGGVKRLDISSSGLDVTGTITQNGIAILPPGLGPLPWSGTTAPTGWLLCYGQSLLRATYAELFAVIGTTYGSADVTHFSLPDLRGRSPFGRDDMGGVAANRLTTAGSGVDGLTLGAVGGAQNQTLLQANLPNVNFVVDIPAGEGLHEHLYPAQSPSGGANVVAAYASGGSQVVKSTGTATLPAMAGTAASGGSATALTTVPPAIIFNYIIYAGV